MACWRWRQQDTRCLAPRLRRHSLTHRCYTPLDVATTMTHAAHGDAARLGQAAAAHLMERCCCCRRSLQE
jgi:hypothetical protein